MKLKSKELKRMARENLNGRYSVPMAALVVTQVLILLVTNPFKMSPGSHLSTSQLIINTLAMLIISLLSSVLSCGLIKIHLNMARGKEIKLTDLFYFFRNRPDRIILSSLLLYLMALLIMIPLIIVSVILIISDTTVNWILFAAVSVLCIAGLILLFLAFSFIFYLLADYPDMGIIAAFRESRHMMKGNKGRLFYLVMSFLGMLFLVLLSFGIGLLFAAPYMTQTTTKFYQNLTGEIS